MSLTLQRAKRIADTALKFARENNYKPVGIVVVDNRGVVKCQYIEDNTPLHRQTIAFSKAYGAVSLGMGTRAIAIMAAERPAFIASVTTAVGNIVPVPGGVLIKNSKDEIIGAIGISGDTSDNDELAAVKGIESVNLIADAG